MAASFFFYDLETSGLNPRSARIMQFAGQRTDLNLQPVGDPVNVLIKLTPDVLPDPDAILITGITPQATISDGMTEAAFLKLFSETIAVPGTIFTGYNSVRFDDEFMRFLHYRNFYDAYRWQWCDDCSRWDLLDVVRMTRALRPDGIKWPVAADGKATNRLELMTALNGLDHEKAHDAENDVQATIAVARLIKAKQPKLFEFLLDMRDKRKVASLVQSRQPFVYTSGKYPAEFEKTTVTVMVADYQKGQGALVFDLRTDPEELAALPVSVLAKRLSWRNREENLAPLPVKILRFNRCPAVAPLSVLDEPSHERLRLDMSRIEAHRQKLARMPELADKLLEVFALHERDWPQMELMTNAQAVDGKLYDGFIGDEDRAKMDTVRTATPEQLQTLQVQFSDQRLETLLPLYKARNYPRLLTSDERQTWDAFCTVRLAEGANDSRLAKYFRRIQVLGSNPRLSERQRYLLEELQLYGESLMPGEAA